jgi:hypothetical protein
MFYSLDDAIDNEQKRCDIEIDIVEADIITSSCLIYASFFQFTAIPDNKRKPLGTSHSF